ncbi:hypothetical protein MmiEs2_04990 [Methanimicrococcus stummii]|uniref:Uncharacterized protein n=1 Tax=Methanimicrococcus stummii TaxID=3028294 RepID=A0AA96V7S9_9EURY|nr:hypothetical protein [Methanimicrococcus sp. Es2]WNY28314.1 hypothetical protein MmiEs2_04990 [Methanimicrococcus sp. Es2]
MATKPLERPVTDIQKDIDDILSTQKRSSRIFSPLEQRSVKITRILAEKKSMTMSEIQSEAEYQYRSGAVKLAERLCQDFPHKYEIIKGKGNNTTILKLTDDYQRTTPQPKISYVRD